MQGRFFRLSLRQNFSLTKHSRTPPHLRSHSSRRPAPTPQCRSFVIRPCPKRNSLIVSHLRSNGSNLHQNFKRRYTRQTPPSIGKTLPRARYSRARQSDLMIRRDAALLKKCISFKLQNDGSRDGEHAGTLYAQAIPTRSKYRSNGLPTRPSQFRSLLKQRGSACTKNANPRPCTGVRDKDGRAYAPIRINIIYMMSNVRLG